jgi:hypothetical protein
MAHISHLAGANAATPPCEAATAAGLTTGQGASAVAALPAGAAVGPGARVAAGLRAGVATLPSVGASLVAVPSLAAPLGAADLVALAGATAALCVYSDQHPLTGPLPELAVGGTPYISGLGPLLDASPPAQQQLLRRRGSPPGFSACAATMWADATAPPPADLVGGHRHRYHHSAARCRHYLGSHITLHRTHHAVGRRGHPGCPGRLT